MQFYSNSAVICTWNVLLFLVMQCSYTMLLYTLVVLKLCCTFSVTDLIGWFTLIIYSKCVPQCVGTFYSDACIQIYMVNTLSTYKYNCNVIIELSYIPCAWLTLITTIIMMTHVWPRCRKILALALLFILSWRCTVSTSVCIHAQSSVAPLLGSFATTLRVSLIIKKIKMCYS